MTKNVAIQIRDHEDSVVAEISRNIINRDSEQLDYIAIWRDDNLICISIEDVPTFLRAVMVAANRTPLVSK